MCSNHSKRQVKTVHVKVKECEKLFDKVLVVPQNIIAFNLFLEIFTFTCNNLRSTLFRVYRSIFGIQCAIFCSPRDFLAGASNTLQRDLVCKICSIKSIKAKKIQKTNVHLKKNRKVMLASGVYIFYIHFCIIFS